MDEKKSAAKELKEKLFMQKKNGWFRIQDGEDALITDFAEGYKDFLDHAKTEREAVIRASAML
ncbi:MAG: aminopeptidase, partial [Ruminococcus sp.]|nr:aminopeptidase [Ruminococcus sp.]